MRELERIIFYLFLLGCFFYAIYFISTGVVLPFYGDELGGYAAAIRHQAENGISLAPNATPYKYTFGHPQMHSVVMAPLAKLFGLKPFGLHLSGLLISLAGLGLLVYYLRGTLKLTWLKVGLIVSLLVIQPVWLTQSYMVHSEMLLLIWFGLTILLAWRKHFLWAAIIASLAVLTKETGVYLVCLLPCIAFYQYLIKKTTLKRSVLNATSILLPIAVFVGYLLVQKEQMGFYLSPTNMGKTTASLDGVYHKLIGTLKFVFVAQNRIFLSVLLLVFVLLKKVKSFVYLRNAMFLIFSFCLASAILSHPIERYLLFPVAVWVLTVAYTSVQAQKLGTRMGFIIIVVLGCNILDLDTFKRQEISDSDLSYRQCIENTEHTIAYINEHKLSPIVLEFPYNFSQQYMHSGYTKIHPSVKVLKEAIDSSHYRVFSWPGNLEHSNDTQTYKLVSKFQYPFSFSEIRVKP